VRIALLDPPGYSSAYDHELASALAARGHDVDLLTTPFPFGDPPEPNGYRRSDVFLSLTGKLRRRRPRSRLRLPLKGAEYLPSVVRLLALVGKLRPDIVHVQWLTLLRQDLRWVARLQSDRPVVFTAHNVMPHLGEPDVEERRRIYTAFDQVVVHTRKGVEQLERYGVPAERIVRIPHGTFGAPPSIEPPSGRRLLFFGLIRRYKGIDVLVRALSEVPDAWLVVAGDPLDPVEPLQELAREVGVADRITWRLGYLPDAEVETLMREATLTVFPYPGGESASGALATALGHGRPAVVTEVLGETVREFGAGAVVAPNDPGALATAIRELLDDPAALQAAFRGTERARAGLSWSGIAEAHERLYSEVLARVAR
jgi:glycosyltransferase involved in cell wall biosynthesis